MESDPVKIKGIGNIKQIKKKKKKKKKCDACLHRMREAYNVLALLTKNCNVFFSCTPLLILLAFSFLLIKSSH